MHAPVYRHLDAPSTFLGLAFPMEWLAVLGAGAVQLAALPGALRELRQTRQLVEPAAAVGRQRLAQDARGAGVDGVDAAFAVERNRVVERACVTLDVEWTSGTPNAVA